MLYDRPYMQSNQNLRSRNLLLGIIVFNVLMYAIQLVAGDGYFKTFALTSNSHGGPHIWSFLTYAFLHDQAGFGHIALNMLGIFFLGRAVLPELGEKRFLQLYLSASLGGGILWYIFSFISGAGVVVGASGALFGLITCFGLIYAESDINFMMVIRMKGKILLYVSLGLAVFGLIFFEVINGFGTAHSAHLGGMLGGYAFYKLIYQRNPGYGKGTTFQMPDWLKPKAAKKPKAKAFPYKINIKPRKDLKAEVDRILDKINSKGFGALTPEEKQILDEAGDLLKNR
jgi:membrane associated rhomboid family serine protease